MLKVAAVLIIFEDADGVRVWSGKEARNLTYLEWRSLVGRVSFQKFTQERSGENVNKGRD